MPESPTRKNSLASSGSSPRRTNLKRPYRKSTKGCTDCKARKIKCDEARPVCLNCRKRFATVNCEYGNASSTASSAERVTDGSVASSKNPIEAALQIMQPVSCKPFDSCETDRLLELRLLWHFTQIMGMDQSLKVIMPQLPHVLGDIIITQVAFSSPAVLHALLGISATHLLALRPHDETLKQASHSYFGKSLTTHRATIANASPQALEPSLVTAVLLAHQVWLGAHITDDENPDVAHVNTYHMCQGIWALLGEASAIMRSYAWAPQRDRQMLRNGISSDEFMNRASEDLRVLSSAFEAAMAPPEDVVIYRLFVYELMAVYTLIDRAGANAAMVEQHVLYLQHRIPERFQELVTQGDPVARALLARNIAPLNLFCRPKSWWIYGAGGYNVPARAVRRVYQLMPREWLWAMEWPLQLVTEGILV